MFETLTYVKITSIIQSDYEQQQQQQQQQLRQIEEVIVHK
jgi:hypothetical protein